MLLGARRHPLENSATAADSNDDGQQHAVATVDVALGNPRGIYEPGQLLNGRVNVRLNNEVQLYAIYLWVIGQAEVMWADAPDVSTNTSFDYEIYMKECFVLWGRGQRQNQGRSQDLASQTQTDSLRFNRRQPELAESGSVETLTAGLHQFDFQYQLPVSLPSSFESHSDQPRLDQSGLRRQHPGDKIKASVRYVLRVKFDSANATLRRLYHDCGFIVLRPLNLNTGHHYFSQQCCWSATSNASPGGATSAPASTQKPLPPIDECVNVHREAVPSNVCSWFPCRSGPVTCTLRLDRRAFVPGEDISVNLEIDNASRREVARSFVAMTQIVHVYTATVRHSADCDVFCISGGKVKAGDSAYYHDIIHIPPLPPSRLDGCNIIDVEYVVKVGVIMASSSVAIMDLSVPVVIGTVPLEQFIMPGLHMSPIFQRYNPTSGEIENYTDDDHADGRYNNVYLYYRCSYSHKALTALQHSNGNSTLIT